jgi:hypothetical protein
MVADGVGDEPQISKPLSSPISMGR